MPVRFSVCVSALYPELPVHEAAGRVHALGFDAYEFWSWQDVNGDFCAQVHAQTGIRCAGMCMPGVPRLDIDPDGNFVKGLEETIALCKKMNCSNIIMQAGDEREGVSRKRQHAGLLEGLKMCAPYAEKAGITLLLEPLNTKVDHPGYYLTEAREAFELVEETGSPCVKVLYDIYHQHITEGADPDVIVSNIHRIGHFHLAGCPGRHEPLTLDRIDTAGILRAIARSNYQGLVGLEYLPASDADESLRMTRKKLEEIFVK